LVGTSLDDAAIALAAQYASEDCNPSTDLRGDIDYKRHIIRAVTKRMINKSKERAFKN
jgi:carbon-monoxide dehydrogenase medium subunit